MKPLHDIIHIRFPFLWTWTGHRYKTNDVSLLSFHRVDVQLFNYSQGFSVALSQVGDGTRRVILGRSNSHRRYLSTSSPFPMIPHINTWRKGQAPQALSHEESNTTCPVLSNGTSSSGTSAGLSFGCLDHSIIVEFESRGR